MIQSRPVCIRGYPHACGGEPEIRPRFWGLGNRYPHTRGGEPHALPTNSTVGRRYPHACGGEPRTGSQCSRQCQGIPTHVGVNREIRHASGALGSYPHTQWGWPGDWRNPEWKSLSYPHTGGGEPGKNDEWGQLLPPFSLSALFGPRRPLGWGGIS